MWVVVFFDLPVMTKIQKTRYRRFRDYLLSDGHIQLQYSVYGRPCASMEIADKHAERIEARVPPEGEVRLLILTSLQFGRMKRFVGETESQVEKPPEQLTFF